MCNVVETFGQQTFNSDGEYTPLIEGIQAIMPEFKRMFNEEIIPSFRAFKRKDIAEYFDSLPNSQRSVEMSKQLGDSINNLFEELLINSGLNLIVERNKSFKLNYYYLNEKKDGNYFCERNIQRIDPILVEVVNELGEKSRWLLRRIKNR